MELRPRIRRRQHRLPSGREGRLLPGRAAGFAARHPRRDVQGTRSHRHRSGSAPPRSGERRPVRDRHQVQHPGAEGRRTAVDEVHHQERRPPQRQDRDLHAEADRRRQRQRHARAHVAGQGRQEPVLRRRLRWPVADGAVVHRRHLQARPRDQRVRQLDHQQLQAPGAGLRGAGDAGLLGAQPLGELPHPVRVQPEGAPHRDPLPGSDELRLPHLRRADDGRPGRHQEPDRPGRAERQGPVRPAAGRREEHPDRLPQPGPGAGSTGQGS